MERPLEIAFHGLDASPSIEAEIRRHVEKLEKRFPRLIGCRVTVEAMHRQHDLGNIPEVHVVLSVPGRDLAVSREPGGRHRPRVTDLHGSVRDAFRAAERQLESHKWAAREDTTAPTAHALAGTVAQIEPGADHGFLLTPAGTQLYFHRDSVTNGRFEDLREGERVHYVEEEGDAGPVAAKVRVAP